MKKVRGIEIQNINISFLDEYDKLTKLLFFENNIRTVDDKLIKVAVDKCIIELKRFTKLTALK